MRTATVAFHSAKRQVTDMMRSAYARFVERDYDSTGFMKSAPFGVENSPISKQRINSE
jgi:hypothetical protein